MASSKFGKNNVSIGSLLIIVGAVIAIISIFLAYVKFDYTILEDVSYTGLDVIKGWGDVELSFVHWAPLVTALGAGIALIMAVLPLFMKTAANGRVLSIIAAVLMLVATVFSIIFVVQGAGPGLFAGDWAELYKGMIETLKTLTMSLGMGAYMGVVGSVVGLIGAALNVKGNV